MITNQVNVGFFTAIYPKTQFPFIRIYRNIFPLSCYIFLYSPYSLLIFSSQR